MSIGQDELEATVRSILTQIMATSDDDDQHKSTKRRLEELGVIPTTSRRRCDWDIYSKLEFPTLNERMGLAPHLTMFEKVLESAPIDTSVMGAPICTSLLNSVRMCPLSMISVPGLSS